MRRSGALVLVAIGLAGPVRAQVILGVGDRVRVAVAGERVTGRLMRLTTDSLIVGVKGGVRW